MRKIVGLVFFVLSGLSSAVAQSFEVAPLQEVYKGFIGETMKIPVRFTNTTEKPLILIVRKLNSTLGGTQNNYFCPDNSCPDQKSDEAILKLDPHESLNTFQIALEAGLASGISSAKYIVINRSNLSENVEFELHFAVEERTSKEDIYISPHITLHDLYPNPATDFAYVNYSIQSDDVVARIIIHNILGNPMDAYDLPPSENKVKIRVESLNAGIYFYTLYLDNEGVMTRKLIVRK
jgi:hypothetical protein